LKSDYFVQNDMAMMEQNKADERVLHLAEEHKAPILCSSLYQ